MVFYLMCSPSYYQGNLKEIVFNLFNKGEIFLVEEEPSLLKENSYLLRGTIKEEPTGITVEVQLKSWQGSIWQHREEDQEILDHRYSAEDWERRCREKLRLVVLKLLEEVFSLPKRPWGILLGVRPTKVIHRLLDKGFTGEEILPKLKENYGLEDNKAELVTRVAKAQRKFLLKPQEAKKKIAIYVGIPFCPTRCLYCSFPAYSLEKNKNLLSPFFQALLREVEALGAFVQGNQLEIESVYLGGGTPTSLTVEQLDILLNQLNEHFHARKTLEFTVEAGRPDTITEEKLQVMFRQGVNRLSINPQSMNNQTLEIIGRRHTVADVYRSFQQAREIGFNLINMDIILGLPGEGLKEVQNTMEQIKELQPENLTCHTMALKRASLLKEKLKDHPFTAESDVEKMLAVVNKYAENLGLSPYYLYRQRYILGNLENIGYASPGTECIYNIQMMEERQTVIALGGGSVSKIIYPPQWQVERFFNPKDPKTYGEQIEEIIKKKLELLGLWLTSPGE